MTVPVGGRLQGWFPLTGLPWNLPAVPGICKGPPPTLDGTSSQAHQLGMSLNVNIPLMLHTQDPSTGNMRNSLFFQVFFFFLLKSRNRVLPTLTVKGRPKSEGQKKKRKRRKVIAKFLCLVTTVAFPDTTLLTTEPSRNVSQVSSK